MMNNSSEVLKINTGDLFSIFNDEEKKKILTLMATLLTENIFSENNNVVLNSEKVFSSIVFHSEVTLSENCILKSDVLKHRMENLPTTLEDKIVSTDITNNAINKFVRHNHTVRSYDMPGVMLQSFILYCIAIEKLIDLGDLDFTEDYEKNIELNYVNNIATRKSNEDQLSVAYLIKDVALFSQDYTHIFEDIDQTLAVFDFTSLLLDYEDLRLKLKTDKPDFFNLEDIVINAEVVSDFDSISEDLVIPESEVEIIEPK